MTSANGGEGSITTHGDQDRSGRGGFTNGDDAFKTRYMRDLDPGVSIDQRISAAYEVSIDINLHSANTLPDLWSVAKDLTTEHATLEARKAGFALLKASASHPGILHEREKLFHMIIVPVDPAEANLQISALNRLTKQGEIISPFETKLIAHLIAILKVLFSAARDARKYRSDVKSGEERSLIGALYLIKDIVNHNPEFFDDRHLDNLNERLSEIVSYTPSRKILNGVVKVLRAVTERIKLSSIFVMRGLSVLSTIYKVPDVDFDDETAVCLSNLLIHQIKEYSMDDRISLLMDQSPVLEIDGSHGYRIIPLKVLTDTILKVPSKLGPSCCVLIKIIGHLFQDIRLEPARKKTFEVHLQSGLQALNRKDGFHTPLVESLANLAMLCGPDITIQSFDILLKLIETGSGISLHEPATSTIISERTADYLIRLFLRCLHESAFKTSKLYELLVRVVSRSGSTVIRLNVMRLLMRLRCNAEQAIEVIWSPDTQGLAGTLYRTQATVSSLDTGQVQISRLSIHEQRLSIRQGRSSVAGNTRAVRSRSATRSSNLKDHLPRPKPPLWIYKDLTNGLPEDPRKGPSQVVYSSLPTEESANVLDLSSWLDVIIDILQDGSDWEIYSYVLVHLPSQLSNHSLFTRHVRGLQTLHNLIMDQLEKSSFGKPPQDTQMMMGDVALCLYHTLTMLVPYHDLFGMREKDHLVRTFSLGISRWDRVGRCCIHALTLCCHEIPTVVDKSIFGIVHKFSQKITQSDLAIDTLEFLGGLARLPTACSNATARLPDPRATSAVEDASFYKTIFGICIGLLRSARELHKGPEARSEFPAYVCALAYQVIIFWFLAIDVGQRAQHVGWIAKELASKEASGKEVLDEQSQVILDMMHRTAFSDLGETEPIRVSNEVDEHVVKQSWLLGMSIVTIEIMPRTNLGHITKRQASGTTHAVYHPNTAALPEHHVGNLNVQTSRTLESHHAVLPDHMLLQLTSTIAPAPIPLQPVKIPEDDFVERALRNFDRINTVDGHKAGVIYIGEGQFTEAEILANTNGTEAYSAFLTGLGTRVKLQGAKFNTQGLDHESNGDGTHTYAWRDRATEMVFHVTTMMPTDNENDPKGINKKKHIGNDRVKIIFNNSGKPFIFDTFQSDLNAVNIVISPEAHASDTFTRRVRRLHRQAQVAGLGQTPHSQLFGYYKVEVLTSSDFPQLSPAATPKVVSADALPGFIRHLALNASAFSQIWSELLGQGEYVSSWRGRLKQINKLREKYANTHTSANISYPMPADADAHAYVEGDDWTGKVTMGGMAEPDQLLMSLDFTRWA